MLKQFKLALQGGFSSSGIFFNVNLILVVVWQNMMKKFFFEKIKVLMRQGCLISFLGVFYVHFSETVNHHDQFGEF